MYHFDDNPDELLLTIPFIRGVGVVDAFHLLIRGCSFEFVLSIDNIITLEDIFNPLCDKGLLLNNSLLGVVCDSSFYGNTSQPHQPFQCHHIPIGFIVCQHVSVINITDILITRHCKHQSINRSIIIIYTTLRDNDNIWNRIISQYNREFCPIYKGLN